MSPAQYRLRASDWNSVVAEPIGLRQCIRIAPKKIYPKSLQSSRAIGLSRIRHS